MGIVSGIEAIKGLQSSSCLVLTNGFEDRIPLGASRLVRAGIGVSRIILIRYVGDEHDASYRKIIPAARRLVSSPSHILEVPATVEAIDDTLNILGQTVNNVICDISGLSRVLMLRALTRIFQRGLRLFLLYTEAKEYYPLRVDFSPFLKELQPGDAFAKLADYEDADVMYSSQCIVEDIEELRGANFPNHPLMLISFLTFKRSRLSAVLNRYETNARVLIEGNPVRKDLKWRKQALEIINFDLINENKGNIVMLPTLYWEKTFEYLSQLYKKNQARYRFNFVLAPLGGKMQTIGAWYFALKYPDVKVITSTPLKLYPDKYSDGYTRSHIIQIPSV